MVRNRLCDIIYDDMCNPRGKRYEKEFAELESWAKRARVITHANRFLDEHLAANIAEHDIEEILELPIGELVRDKAAEMNRRVDDEQRECQNLMEVYDKAEIERK